MYQQEFMQRALALSALALTQPGTEPFGAVVVKDGAIVGEGFNHSVAHSDPTSHGEVEAIRDACRRLGTVDLSGCELYTSCEPCAMCAAAMHIAGIARLYYAASLAQSGQAFEGVTVEARHPIDVEALRAEAGAPLDERRLPAEQKLDGEAVRILAEWAATRRAR
ncbi:tRNA-specific adenosine deaminase [Variovorax paradoxus]|uniref:tRNA-specific adenosine deaminase n=1 Tax=Variovorax paradoxus TaxID=34073 RepID=A0AA91DHT5_VARPD|nr:nucleoside deaminase [Variovorax paradoxus]OAK56813.1 tRNA-specific adenosine deaminase [Variovorax paradoxus]